MAISDDLDVNQALNRTTVVLIYSLVRSRSPQN